ncbi:calphotin-like [Helianthus annuus]|uniref:calphotin-like n=1 Tax=Helianthus annuus TaxID=4232 RepID=UPI001652F570|nr:calphotin-like [Helianthus annuus]
MEDPVDPVDLADPAFADHEDFEMAFDDPEPAMALEPVAAPDPVFEHDPVHADAPIIDPVIADPPIDDHPVDAPLLEGDHIVAADHVDAPLIADVPVDPLVAPHLDPMPVQFDHALFEAHAGPRDEHAQHGWIDDDDEYPPFVVPVTPVPAPVSVPPEIPLHPVHTTGVHHTDLPAMFHQFTTPARPGEGSSAHPFGHVPTSIPVVPQFSTAIPPVPPFPVLPFDPANFEMEFDAPEPAVAPEPVAALDPVFEHDPIHADVPIADPVIADLPIDDHPVVAPPLEGDHAVVDAQADAPLIVDMPAEPVVVAPFPDPVPLEPDHALFGTHIDSRYAHTRNGCIDDDDEYPPFVVPVTPVPAPVSVPPEIPLHPVHTTGVHHTDLPVMFHQFTPPARPGEGSSTHPFGHVPTSIPVVPQFSTVLPPVPPFSVPPFAPASEPLLWTSPPIMPPSDPYHPFHMGP